MEETTSGKQSLKISQHIDLKVGKKNYYESDDKHKEQQNDKHEDV